MIGLLCFYDESPAMLEACIDGVAPAVRHLLAVDGAYALFPDGKARSPREQWTAIYAACERHGIRCTIDAPTQPWPGEVEKRTAAFSRAYHAAGEGEWILSVDADEVITSIPSDLHDRLADSTYDVAEVAVVDVPAREAYMETGQPEFAGFEHTTRCVFRAQPIRCVVNHYTYLADDGSVLRDASGQRTEAPAVELYDLVIEHRYHTRELPRHFAKMGYYEQRDLALVERGKCERCDEQAIIRMPARWDRDPAGGLVSRMAELCERHARQADRTNRRRVRAWGMDPDDLGDTREQYQAPPRRKTSLSR